MRKLFSDAARMSILLASLAFSLTSQADARTTSSCSRSSEKRSFKGKPEVGPLTEVTFTSQLPPNLVCLNLNNPDLDLTGYTWYSNVFFDSKIAVNPTNPDNMIIACQENVITNGNTGDEDLPIAIVVWYTVDGGEHWNESDLVLSRCVQSTLYQGNDNFLSAYFPFVTFDSAGNGYVISSSYNLFAADQQPTVNFDEGNIIAKTTDGGASWNRATSAYRDDGSCHFLDFPSISGDPYREETVYIVSADTTCYVSDTCTDPNYNGNNNIIFQKTTDGGAFWTSPSIIASFPSDPSTCTPTPFKNKLVVLPDEDHTLFVTSYIQENTTDIVFGTNPDSIVAYTSQDQGDTWTSSTVVNNISHILPFDPATSSPYLPLTQFAGKSMDVDPSSGYIYIAYQDPQFNLSRGPGVAIIVSKDKGKTWSAPQPVNPMSLSSQAFLPAVAVAEDGTVGVLFYDLRNYQPGDPSLNTDVWVSFFSKGLKQYKGEVRLTPESFDSRLTIRGYNGIDPANCIFDYYISNTVGLSAAKNDFVASFTATNNSCPPVLSAPNFCDSFPLAIDDCDRQNIFFTRIKRH